jgi:DNA polymerase I-like protein with 3'-5' exonuclease and polymerase domains/uracil-DNA glycosylase
MAITPTRVQPVAPQTAPAVQPGQTGAPVGIVSRTLTEHNFVMPDAAAFPFPRRGPGDAPILVICDSPSIDAMKQGLPMSQKQLSWFAKRALAQGFVEADFQFITLCPPIKQNDLGSAKRKWDHVKQYEERLRELVEEINPKAVVTCGELATRVMVKRAVKITKARGITTRAPDTERIVFPVLSPKLCTKMPDYMPIFDADLGTLHRLKTGRFDPESLQVTDVDYQWCTELQFMIDNKPSMMAVDTEGSGLKYRDPDFEVYTVQISTGPGLSVVCPVSWTYYKRHEQAFRDGGIHMTEDQCKKLAAQVKTLMEDASILKMAHNFKFDDGCMNYSLGANTQGWDQDTELMTRAVNENMMSYSLDDCVRVYVPEMAGYADHFNTMVDKSRMIDVPPFDVLDAEGKIAKPGMLNYAGGDPDAVYRLARALWPMLKRDPGQMFLYKQVNMRGLISFAKRIESFGQCIDRAALDAYKAEVDEWVTAEGRALFRLIPAAIRRKYLLDPKGASFTRDVFIQDILFSEEGFNLKPTVFTTSTKDLPHDQRVPSVSTKDHLPYFTDRKDAAGNFVRRFIDFKKAQKLLSTYIDGFYKYLRPANDNSGEEKIYPSYNFRTNTYRTNSQDPNGQNFPKRGNFAAGFLRLIKASAGKVLIACDMSQVELRLTAWSAMEREMLRIYNTGGDIHEATAATVMRLTIEQFRALPAAEKKLQRFRAKAVNFGFIYGAQWKTFQTYAKTNYGADYTDKEAEEVRELYFQKYNLIPWHGRVEDFVKEHGYVKTLHGGTRHLPSVWSDEWKIATGAIRQAINAPIQRMGSDLGVIAIARLAAQCDPRLMRPVGFVHDQIVCEVDPGWVEQCMGWLTWVMENPPLNEWFGVTAPLPFVADPEYGMNLYETTEVRREHGTSVYINDKTKEPMENIRNEQPEWWNNDEGEAYEKFMRNEVPDWMPAPVNPRARVRHIVG